MNRKTSGGRAIRIASVGHVAFAVTMIILGILGVIRGNLAPIWQPVPEGVPVRTTLMYLCAFIPLASGIRPALATRSRHRCPRAARLFPALVARIASASRFHLAYREHLVGELPDRGDDGGNLGAL